MARREWSCSLERAMANVSRGPTQCWKLKEETLCSGHQGRDEGSELRAEAGAVSLLFRNTRQVLPFPVQHIQCVGESFFHSIRDWELIWNHRSRPRLCEYNSFILFSLGQKEVETRSWLLGKGGGLAGWWQHSLPERAAVGQSARCAGS